MFRFNRKNLERRGIKASRSVNELTYKLVSEMQEKSVFSLMEKQKARYLN